MVNQIELRGDIKGANVTMGGISNNDLLFANNYVLFCRASCQEWSKLQKILYDYKKGSGHVLNKQKTFIFFSPNKSYKVRHLVLQATSGVAYGSFENYLRLPAMVGRKKHSIFKWLK